MIRSFAAGIALSAAALTCTPAFADLLNANVQAGGQALDINVATADQLQRLGFMMSEAKQIVAAVKHDPFETVQELKSELTFVTDAKLAALKGQLAVGTEMVGKVTDTAGGLVGGVANTAGGLVNTTTTKVGQTVSPINVNTATVAQLQQLGFPLQTASNIVAKVKSGGPLASVDALIALPGVNAPLVNNLVVQGSLTVN